jgi:hypothetical protein
VRLMGRADLKYTDEFGELAISAEAMSKPWTDIVVYSSSIPESAERSREEVLRRLYRAFEFAGWTLIEENA